jgi:hypothetical protein
MQASAELPPSNWWQRASRTQTGAVVVGASAALFVVLVAFDTIIKLYPGGYPFALLSDVCVSFLAGALLWRTITDSQARYRAVLQRLEMIAEMNHHIRNALELIELSAHTTQNAELIANIESAAGRIQWALREILPQATSVAKAAD